MGLNLYANLDFMLQEFHPGDFLIFQLESGFALLRVLDVSESDGAAVWHLAAYRDFFLDVETAEKAIAVPSDLKVDIPHAALTSRAFESTQVSRLGSAALTDSEIEPYDAWQRSDDRHVSDRSIRLLMGLR